jgi:hypothetical protein
MLMDGFRLAGGEMLKNVWPSSVLFSIWLLMALVAAGSANQSEQRTFSGEIMDSLCAKDGSHQKMMDQMKSMGRDPQTCAQKCIQLGAKYVLYDPTTKTVYNIDDQDKAARFAGQKVKIKGMLEKKKIKIADIESGD